VPTPCSSTPAGPTRQAIAASRRGRRSVNNDDTRDVVLSGLNHTASALAVIRFADPVTRTDA